MRLLFFRSLLLLFLLFFPQQVFAAEVSSTDPLEAVVRQTVVTLKGVGFGPAFERGKDQFCLGDKCLLDDFVSEFIVSWTDTEIQVKLPPISGADLMALTILKWKALREDQTPIFDILRSAPIKVIFQQNPQISSLSSLVLVPGQTVLTIAGSGFESGYTVGSHRICFFQNEMTVLCMRDEDQSRYVKSWISGEIQFLVPPFVSQLSSPKFSLRLYFPNDNVYKLVTFPDSLQIKPAPFVERYFPRMRNGDQYTLLGVYFGDLPGKIFLGNTEARVNGWSASSLTFTAPEISGTFDLVVENIEGVRSSPISVQVIFEKRFSSDLLSKHQQYLENIRIPEAWKITEGSPDIVVAVIDSGVDRSHEDLQGSFWVNPKEVQGNGFDDDGNGFVDDFSGWDFVSNSNNEIPVNDHGTMVASVIAAKKDNQLGLSGIAPNVKIMSLSVGTKTGASEDSISVSAVQNAIKYAVDQGAQIINLSLSGTASKSYFDVLQYAYDNNVLVVAAAGNDGINLDEGQKSPVCNDADLNIVLGVASVTRDNTRSLFSNFGRRCIDISAPGSEILTASQKGYHLSGGTSFAAPMVAGVAALVKSLHPDWNVEEIKAAILSTAVSIDLQNPDFREKMGRGLIDSFAALSVSRPIVSYQGKPRKNLVIQKTTEVIGMERPEQRPLEQEKMVKNPESEIKPDPVVEAPKQEIKKESRAEMLKKKKEEQKLKRQETLKKKKEALKKRREELQKKRLELRKKAKALRSRN